MNRGPREDIINIKFGGEVTVLCPVPSKNGLAAKPTHFYGKFPPLNGCKISKREKRSGHGTLVALPFDGFGHYASTLRTRNVLLPILYGFFSVFCDIMTLSMYPFDVKEINTLINSRIRS